MATIKHTLTADAWTSGLGIGRNHIGTAQPNTWLRRLAFMPPEPNARMLAMVA